ncbi:MAG: MerR family transcriptional regulator [Sphingobacteriales bacterium JAD_PAG50586_3]|nr:MAG: MerR family transcriptional regulator [Sphingobacteriales bacterium JAD_PAG50586_3]
MPYKDKETEKLYWTIGEVSEMFKVNTSLIRFWEKEFDIIKPHKNKKGNRLFTKTDVEYFRMIYYLVKERGFTLEGARKKLKGTKDEASQIVQTIDRLKELKVKLVSLKESL